MNNNPLVSIVIPVYNGANYLSEAIDSALSQTYKNIEVLVINDGSNDAGATRSVALNYDDKIRYFEKENGGVASALNLGVEKMKGEYFSWLSHDDLYLPQKIEEQLIFIGKSSRKSAILYSDYSAIDEKGNFIRENRVTHIEPDAFRIHFVMGGLINGCTLLVPLRCFNECGLFNTNLRTTQDYDLWFRFSEKFEFIHMPVILVKSRLHPNQDTVKLRPIVVEECDQLCLNFIRVIRNEEIRTGYSKPVPIYYFDFARIMLGLSYRKAMRLGIVVGLANFYQLDFRYFGEFWKSLYNLAKASVRGLGRKLAKSINMSRTKKDINVFEKIYQSNSWGDRESKSGTGSNLQQTAEIRRRLPTLLKELDVETMLDIPCGDFFWMKEVQGEISEVLDSYIGADLVQGIVNINRENFSSQKFSFDKMNLTSSPLPKVDLILNRDCLVHLSYKDIYKALRNIQRSKSKYLLTTSFNASNRANRNIRTGSWRPLSLQKFPFSFRSPTIILLENCTEDGGIYFDKTLMLWRVEDINISRVWLNIHAAMAIDSLRRLVQRMVR